MFSEVIKYIGCIGIKTSMRSLEPETRTEVAKESINRLCKANNISRRSESKSSDDVERMLDDKPNLTHSGTNVQLCVKTTHLNVISKDTGDIIIQHEMPNVSFASSGDKDTVDFVAYVAKDATYGRACFVLECGFRTGKNVLESIAHGFEMRSKQILDSSNTLSMKSPSLSHDQLRYNSCFTNAHFHSSDSQDASSDASFKNNNENDDSWSKIEEIRASLNREPWFHGSNNTREESESRLKQDGDFLVRESMFESGQFVLSVMYEGQKLHLLFDSLGKVKTKEMVFNNISHMIRFHHDHNHPIVADSRVVYLRNGVRPSPRQ